MYRSVDQRIVADRLEYLRSQANPRRRNQKHSGRRHALGRKVGHAMIRMGLRLAHDDAARQWRLVIEN